MTKITFISPDTKQHTVTATNGESLMDAAVDNDIPGIDADCGGSCACATCHILVPDAYMSVVSPMDEDEQYLLDFLDNRQKNSRLSCQINVTDKLDGMVITVPKQP